MCKHEREWAVTKKRKLNSLDGGKLTPEKKLGVMRLLKANKKGDDNGA